MTLAKQIAIDGPAGAGKSTVARLVADRLGYLYIDTGAMYRAVALLALRAGVALDDAENLTSLAEGMDLELASAPGGCRVLAEGEDITVAIRLPEVGNAASPVSAVAGVRKALVARQQALAAMGAVVMDGRDIGTVVLPEAACKIYLTASPQVRAERRTRELLGKGITADPEQIEQELMQRDQRDMNREHSPLCQAKDAVLLDSSGLTIDQVVERIVAIAEECP